MQGSGSQFGVTADDLRSYDWQEVVASAPRKECNSYHSPLFQKAEELKNTGDDRGGRVFSLLAFLATFAPFEIWQRRSYDDRINILQDEDFSALRTILPEIQDPEFRALVADILWEQKKDPKAAEQAITALSQSADVLEEADMWPRFVGRLERALRLATRLKFKDQEDDIFRKIEETILRYENDTTAGLLCAQLMGFLLNGRRGNPENYALLSEKLAVANCDLGRWDFSHEYWSLAGTWHGRAKNTDAKRNTLIQAAETYVKKAETNMVDLIDGKPRYGIMYSAHWMGAAVEALRQAQAAERAAELHKRFLELEALSMSEMKTITIDADQIPGMRESHEKVIAETQALMSGMSLSDAIFKLAFIVQPTDPAKLKEDVEKRATQSLFHQLFASQTVSSKGKVTDKAPPVSSNDVAQREEAVKKEMYQQSRTIGWPLRVQLYIAPALEQLVKEHAVTVRDLIPFVANHPFIPLGHEGVFARGLHAGFEGDRLVALHLLIPQIENGVRFMFEKNGEIVSSFDSDGIQNEKDLGWLLTHQQMPVIFGEKMAFELRGLLIERFGCNLRNQLAHGLLPEAAFYTDAAVYLWWIALRLICIPSLYASKESRIEKIRILAYQVWEGRNASGEQGDALGDWLEAEKLYGFLR